MQKKLLIISGCIILFLIIAFTITVAITGKHPAEFQNNVAVHRNNPKTNQQVNAEQGAYNYTITYVGNKLIQNSGGQRYVTITFSLTNYTNVPLSISPQYFVLTSSKGTVYTPITGDLKKDFSLITVQGNNTTQIQLNYLFNEVDTTFTYKLGETGHQTQGTITLNN